MSKKVRLADVVKIAGRVGWKGYTVDDLREEGPWVIGANDITTDNRLDLSKAKHISREKYEESPEIMIELNDILIVKVGSTIGKVAIVNRDIGEACINPNSVILKHCKINPHYLYYYLISSAGQAFLMNNSSASAQSALNQMTLKEMLIEVVDEKIQNIIASLLNAIASKIETNSQVNLELEKMAKVFYDYWFVQFDFPDVKGMPYKTSGGKMGWNEEFNREIPRGWEIKSLADLASLISRGISPSYTENDGIPVLNQKCIRNRSINFTLGRRHNHAQKNASSKLIQVGDVLVNSTGVGTLGRVAVVKRLEEPLTTVDSHVSIVRIDRNKANQSFIGYSLTEKQTEIEALGEGSTGQTELSRDNLGQLKMILPDSDLQKKFDDFITPIFQKIGTNEKENQQLSDLRDWLLPMLMNGQVKVGGYGAAEEDQSYMMAAEPEEEYGRGKK